MESHANRWRTFVGVGGSILAFLSIVYLTVTLFRNLGSIPEIRWNQILTLPMLVCAVFYPATFLLLTAAWRILLKRSGHNLSYRDCYVIMGRSQIAKYLPGNVFHYVGRIVLGKASNVPSEIVLVSIGMETLLISLTALIIVLVGFWSNSFLQTMITRLWSRGNVVLPPLAISGVVVIIIVLVLISPRARRWLALRMSYLHPRVVLPVMSLYAILLFLNGPIISLLLRTIWNVTSVVPWYQLSFGYTLAWLLGFIMPGAPGGVGIREVVFVSLFGSALGDGLAAGVAVGLRILTSISDLLMFLLAYWLGSLEVPHSPTSSPQL